MRKFEIGKRYYQDGATYKIIRRTAKTVKYAELQHAGRFNERVMEEKTARIKDWGDREVFFAHNRITVEA